VAAEVLTKLVGVKDVAEERVGDWSIFTMRLDANATPGEDILRLATTRRWNVRELYQRRATLEDVFVDLTHEAA